MLPEKKEWKSHTPAGLSASTFGHALGLLGCVSDYVTYVREYERTELGFTGNEATAHGIRTEPISRTVYEMLTGQVVDDGGFFVYQGDRTLACSPDGIVWKAGHEGQVIERLLEIKSPYGRLYDGTKELYKPFGIPQQYMCQMQGQMTIAGCDECDFFVYLHNETEPQVEAWRVRRSPHFWEWMQPKLLQVSDWIRNGLPEGINRSFKFEPYPFEKLDVEPLVSPVLLSTGMQIRDAKRFSYFLDRRTAAPDGLRGAPIRLVYHDRVAVGDTIWVDGELLELLKLDMEIGRATVRSLFVEESVIDIRYNPGIHLHHRKVDVRPGSRVRFARSPSFPAALASMLQTPKLLSHVTDTSVSFVCGGREVDDEEELVTVPRFLVCDLDREGASDTQVISWDSVRKLLTTAEVLLVPSVLQDPDRLSNLRTGRVVFVAPHVAKWLHGAAEHGNATESLRPALVDVDAESARHSVHHLAEVFCRRTGQSPQKPTKQAADDEAEEEHQRPSVGVLQLVGEYTALFASPSQSNRLTGKSQQESLSGSPRRRMSSSKSQPLGNSGTTVFVCVGETAPDPNWRGRHLRMVWVRFFSRLVSGEHRAGTTSKLKMASPKALK